MESSSCGTPMSSPGLTSSSSGCFSSPVLGATQSSNTIVTPSTGRRTRFQLFEYMCGDDGDKQGSSDEDVENIDPRAGPSTPCRKSIRWSSMKTPSPSNFIVKGTVTPSRAAPLFARFSSSRCSVKRPRLDTFLHSESDDGDDDDVFVIASTASSNPQVVDEMENEGSEGALSLDSLSRPQKACFIRTSYAASGLPRLALPLSNTFSHRAATTDVGSYLLGVRSNSLHRLPWARSAGTNYAGSTGRGVLGVSRMLGAGSGQHSVSYHPHHSTFRTQSVVGRDLFALPSSIEDREVAHPLCAEYANSSRSLSNYRAQWLAVGDNEGRVHLLNTLHDPMANLDTNQSDKPCWDACQGSVFELKWRQDDEMIATGGSDYFVKIWCTETGTNIRTFRGHRGSPRSIAWDPDSGGHLLISAGRDGAMHMYDMRIRDGYQEGAIWSPCLSLWEAHTEDEPTRLVRGPGIRSGNGRGKKLQAPKGITSLAYLPGRSSKLLASAGCADGKIRLWDLRFLERQRAATGGANFTCARRRAKGEEISLVDPVEQSSDMTRGSQTNKSAHGISSIVVGSSKVFAACTDGRIYTLNIADFLIANSTSLGHPTQPLFHEKQRGNTLFARMALHDDDRTLALGCNTGVVTLWDTHAASLALGESQTRRSGYAVEEEMGERRSEAHLATTQPAVLQRGHNPDFEVSCVSWAHGPQGATLASISDDFTIRTWHSSPRSGRNSHGLLDSDEDDDMHSI